MFPWCNRKRLFARLFRPRAILALWSSCSADKTILLVRLGDRSPMIRRFQHYSLIFPQLFCVLYSLCYAVRVGASTRKKKGTSSLDNLFEIIQCFVSVSFALQSSQSRILSPMCSKNAKHLWYYHKAYENRHTKNSVWLVFSFCRVKYRLSHKECSSLFVSWSFVNNLCLTSLRSKETSPNRSETNISDYHINELSATLDYNNNVVTSMNYFMFD